MGKENFLHFTWKVTIFFFFFLNFFHLNFLWWLWKSESAALYDASKHFYIQMKAFLLNCAMKHLPSFLKNSGKEKTTHFYLLHFAFLIIKKKYVDYQVFLSFFSLLKKKWCPHAILKKFVKKKKNICKRKAIKNTKMYRKLELLKQVQTTVVCRNFCFKMDLCSLFIYPLNLSG